jgi:uncharacterized membrane protein (UPF0182 family)
LATIASAWFVVKAFDYLLVQRPNLATNRYGPFDGPGYAELNGPGAAYQVLPFVCLAAAIALVIATRRHTWRPAVLLVGTWAVVHVATVWILPVALRRLVVAPAEAARQLPYIAHNLESTRAAYGLQPVTVSQVRLADGLSGPLDAPAADDLLGVPLFDADQLAQPLQVLQGTTATRVHDVDLDRYSVDGELRPVLIASRDASKADLPERGWVQDHLVYTHGDGVIASLADVTTDGGSLVFNDLERTLGLRRTALYFGEGLGGWYAITQTKRQEIGAVPYEGSTGVALSSRWRRLVTATALGEYEPLVSSELTSQSQLLYRRDVRERLNAIAPFLAYDSDPYPVIADGRVVWVVDAYTTASTYPYGQFAPTAGLPSTSDLSGASLNWVTASVKATVDAYDGTVHLYRTDSSGPQDPILRAWDRVLPGLFEPISDMAASIRSHLRYPSDLYALQTELLGRYHVTVPELLFNGSQAWFVSPDPGRTAEDTGSGPSRPVWQFLAQNGTDDWSSVRSYSPGAAANPSSARDQLAAFAVGDHETGSLRLLDLISADERQLTSPRVAQSIIAADPELSRQFTLLNANGSKVQFGPMTPLLVDESLVWIRPVLVTSTASVSTPRLFSILAVTNGRVGVGDTIASAIAAVHTPNDS